VAVHKRGGNTDDPIVRAILSTPALSREENAALSRTVSAGGDAAKEALDRMVAGNMRLVLSIARRYPDGTLTLHDRLQEGAMGLMRAARKFDPDRGFSFATYASYWIRAGIDRAIQGNEHALSVPHNVVTAMRRLGRLESMSSRPLSSDEVDDALRMGPRTVDVLRVMKSVAIPLDSPINGPNGGDMLLSEVIADDSIDDPETTALDKDVWVALDKCSTLSNRDLAILSLYLSGESYTRISLKYGLSRERVRQIVVKVVDTMRRILER
jgi:RNA polymerase sigma factor (sigma-70 family)